MPVDRNRLIRTSVRVAAALAVGAVAVGVVGAAAVVAWPDHRAEPGSVVVEPDEAVQQRICPGPLLSIGDDASAATALESFGSAAVVSAAVPGEAELGNEPLDAPENPRAAEDGAPVVIDAQPGAADAGMIAGAQSQTARTEVLGGFTAASCTEAVSESWLVAGATTVGRSSLILLANPTDVTATVDVRVLGENGPVEARSAIGITVAPRTQRVLSLAGLAPNLASPVVHVTSTGGAIAASLEQSAISGLAPAGIELTGPTAPPSTSQVIPGLVIGGSGGVAADDDHAEGDGFPAVRIHVPGTEAVEASVGVVPVDGGGGDSFDVELQPGTVSDIPLGDLAAGTYTVRVEADGPIVAAGRATTGTPEESDAAAPADFAWFVAVRPLLETAVLAVASGPSATLQLAAGEEGAAEASVTVDGRTTTVEVPALGAVSVPLRGREVVLEGVEGASAAVSYADDRALAAFAVRPPGPLDSPIRVYPN
ncbi:DUF5719 family protein [Agromyces salentinus]|uniref:Large extracellular alpha-helical protein n=1 Tax=Agromyces salentinus TaxID=269421 RepID=A0ABP4Z4N8_9MICO|nr:DUF5719 family protein [Agromyces salentinus]